MEQSEDLLSDLTRATLELNVNLPARFDATATIVVNGVWTMVSDTGTFCKSEFNRPTYG